MRLLTFVLVFLCAACSGPSGSDGGYGGGSTGTGGGATGTGGGTGGSGGAGGGTTGTGGGTTTGDGGFYGTVKCPNAAYLVCDDFEGAAIDTNTWRIYTFNNGTLTPDTSKAARGSKSLHVVAPASGGDAMVELKTPVALDGQRLWGRMFMFVPGRVEAQLMNHTNIVTATGTNSIPTVSVYAAWWGLKRIGSLFYQENPPEDVSGLNVSPNVFVPLDRWFCVEWDFNGVDKQIRIYLDGALIPMSELNGYKPPVSAVLRNGIQYATEEAWFDSVAWSRTRVGCDQ